MTDDDDFVPRPVPPIRPAIPVTPAPPPSWKSIGAMPARDNGIPDPPLREELPKLKPKRGKDPVRVARAKAAWERRRDAAPAHPLPDRHAIGGFYLTVSEAIELARLIEKHPLLKKVLVP